MNGATAQFISFHQDPAAYSNRHFDMLYSPITVFRLIAELSPAGFTRRIADLETVTTGYSVAYRETQDGYGDAGLRAAIDHATQHAGFVGGWLDTQTGRYYFDSVRIFDNEAEAIRFGRENGQLAIWNFADMAEIRL
jgi:fructokinase